MSTVGTSGRGRCPLQQIVFFRLTVADIANILEESENIIDPTFSIEPPDNPALSDCDSDDDDSGNINHLSGNQLRAGGELIGRKLTEDGLVTIRIGGIPEEKSDQEEVEQVEDKKFEEPVDEDDSVVSVDVVFEEETQGKVSKNTLESRTKKENK
ncbi:hypothetical protein J6590_095989 [Homalodisca vitripennis]|nr:hypothetical protein J6590_095989 [Homalodisca vitripennis]